MVARLGVVIAAPRRRIPRPGRIVACLPRSVSIVRAGDAVSGHHLFILTPKPPS
jgi:hypothetical protein